MPQLSALIFDLFGQEYVLGFVSALGIKSIPSTYGFIWDSVKFEVLISLD
jgi:hypothetical protein